jgi:galactokinase/mevalonate kinase-like predicted kinase
MPSVEHLLSLPPAMATWLKRQPSPSGGAWFCGSDPAGVKLGSGGGLAQLLADAWQAGGSADFDEWLSGPKRLALLAGGQSRRLPAYAATGKIFMPMPIMRWAFGQRLDQTLLDLQAGEYARVLEACPEGGRVMVTSGDVFLAFPEELPEVPEADVVGFGMAASPESAAGFGVFFSPHEHPRDLEFFLQKPDPAHTRRLARDHAFLVDSGVWLLSRRAIALLMRLCGWDGGRWGSGNARFFELYSGFGLSLGRRPAVPDAAFDGLTSAVVPVPGGEFYHFGTTRQMIESVSQLQNRAGPDMGRGDFWRKPHPDMYVLNSEFEFRTRSAAHSTIWIENCSLPPELRLPGGNVLTGAPSGVGEFDLGPGLCVDFVPVDGGWCVRPYGLDDSFAGPVGEASWMGRPARQWFAARGLTLEQCGIDPQEDIQESSLFAVVGEPDARWVSWLTSEKPEPDALFSDRWMRGPRHSARALGEVVDLDRLLGQRREFAGRASRAFWDNRASNPFFRVDLENAAAIYAATDALAPEAVSDRPMERIQEAAFAAAVDRVRGGDGTAGEKEAFSVLASRVVAVSEAVPASPRNTLLDDQILWARSPVRLDLAGGWSDTPPFCLKHGGAVVNLAVDINGQAPVQGFVRVCPQRHIVIRSIDLGAEKVVNSVEELADCAVVGGEFSLAKAALCLAGFHPRFRNDGARDLDEILQRFGGGVEISLLAATPKGSGLGTSSVLAATLLAALSSTGGLAWDHAELVQRTLALEQMLSTGGGWQDQAGGIYHGIKLVETAPGFEQKPVVRWLPEELFGPDHANRRVLLYYTGITRVAKTILQEIVRGMFLNSAVHLRNLFAIRRHALKAYEVIQRESYPDLCRVVARSWELNCALDAGTNPPGIAALRERIAPWMAAGKLLGAGGGGYMLIFAKDDNAASSIRRELEERPPNPGARFVDFSVSRTGLQITRS